MHVAVRTVRVVRTEATEKEWDALRQLVAEGLPVVEAITPAMAQAEQRIALFAAQHDLPLQVRRTPRTVVL